MRSLEREGERRLLLPRVELSEARWRLIWE